MKTRCDLNFVMHCVQFVTGLTWVSVWRIIIFFFKRCCSCCCRCCRSCSAARGLWHSVEWRHWRMKGDIRVYNLQNTTLLVFPQHSKLKQTTIFLFVVCVCVCEKHPLMRTMHLISLSQHSKLKQTTIFCVVWKSSVNENDIFNKFDRKSVCVHYTSIVIRFFNSFFNL